MSSHENDVFPDSEPTTSTHDPRPSTQYSFTPSPENSKTSTKPDLSDDEEKKDDSMFVCNICLDIAKDAVVSMCGHLYCWPCLSKNLISFFKMNSTLIKVSIILDTWLETRPTKTVCPVCKAAISKEKVIPLYGRNSDKQEDPRSKIPPRPQGQRTEPDPSQGFQGFQSFGGDGGFHLSFGIGAFPFGFFASSFNFNDMRPTRNGQQQGTPQHEEDQFLSKAFLWVALLFFSWLILA